MFEKNNTWQDNSLNNQVRRDKDSELINLIFNEKDYSPNQARMMAAIHYLCANYASPEIFFNRDNQLLEDSSSATIMSTTTTNASFKDFVAYQEKHYILIKYILKCLFEDKTINEAVLKIADPLRNLFKKNDPQEVQRIEQLKTLLSVFQKQSRPQKNKWLCKQLASLYESEVSWKEEKDLEYISSTTLADSINLIFNCIVTFRLGANTFGELFGYSSITLFLFLLANFKAFKKRNAVPLEAQWRGIKSAYQNGIKAFSKEIAEPLCVIIMPALGFIGCLCIGLYASVMDDDDWKNRINFAILITLVFSALPKMFFNRSLSLDAIRKADSSRVEEIESILAENHDDFMMTQQDNGLEFRQTSTTTTMGDTVEDVFSIRSTKQRQYIDDCRMALTETYEKMRDTLFEEINTSIDTAESKVIELMTSLGFSKCFLWIGEAAATQNYSHWLRQDKATYQNSETSKKMWQLYNYKENKLLQMPERLLEILRSEETETLMLEKQKKLEMEITLLEFEKIISTESRRDIESRLGFFSTNPTSSDSDREQPFEAKNTEDNNLKKVLFSITLLSDEEKEIFRELLQLKREADRYVQKIGEERVISNKDDNTMNRWFTDIKTNLKNLQENPITEIFDKINQVIGHRKSHIEIKNWLNTVYPSLKNEIDKKLSPNSLILNISNLQKEHRKITDSEETIKLTYYDIEGKIFPYLDRVRKIQSTLSEVKKSLNKLRSMITMVRQKVSQREKATVAQLEDNQSRFCTIS